MRGASARSGACARACHGWSRRDAAARARAERCDYAAGERSSAAGVQRGYPMRAPWHRRAARCARLGAWSVHITRRTALGRRI
nr:MAG TPA: hypothetical protein [Caudoviricetes sp.]